MPSFRAPKTQAQHAVSQRLALGIPRHGHSDDKLIHSVATAHAYTTALVTYTTWLKDERLGDLRSASRNEAVAYLELRSTEVGQAQLNKDRQAIQAVIGERLPALRSEVEAIRSAKLYTPEQTAMIRDHQAPHHRLSSELVERAGGLRAHELLSVRLASQNPRSSHREWRTDLHVGIEGRLYTVKGKGGLTREIVVPRDLADRLEATRLDTPLIVVDRGIRYVTHYAIGGGQAWSQSFSAASSRALGWSAGGHSIRATWACERVTQLQSMGYSYDDAKAITSQNLGHFRPDVLDYYLR